MKFLSIKKIRHIGITTNSWWGVSKYIHLDNDYYVSERIIIENGFDDILFVYIYSSKWSNEFILENSNLYDKLLLDKIINKHNYIVRNKIIDNVID